LKQVHFGYGAKPIYQGLDFEIERDQRLVLVGPNGAGKSTMLKLLAGVLTPSAGERVLGHNVRAGYYSQNRVEMLRVDRTVLEEALDTPQRVTEVFVRNILGCFLFSGDDVLKPVRVLSGGEKSRLALVKLLLDPPNLLLMDEPTTHLDMASIEALIAALEQYEGTLCFISHDVYFIRALANQVVHVEHGKVQRFLGNYDYYVEKTAAAAAAAARQASGKSPVVERVTNSKEQRRIEAEERQARSKVRKQLQNAVDQFEKRIQSLEKRQSELHTVLQDPATYARADKGASLNRELMEVEDELGELHPQWEEAATKLAAFDAEKELGRKPA